MSNMLFRMYILFMMHICIRLYVHVTVLYYILASFQKINVNVNVNFFIFGRMFATIVTNFRFIISLHIVCTFVANHYQLFVFLVFQLDWRVTISIIIKVFMKKLKFKSLCQHCWLEDSSYHVIYINKFMNFTQSYFS